MSKYSGCFLCLSLIVDLIGFVYIIRSIPYHYVYCPQNTFDPGYNFNLCVDLDGNLFDKLIGGRDFNPEHLMIGLFILLFILPFQLYLFRTSPDKLDKDFNTVPLL
jgi:hypothetical protein